MDLNEGTIRIGTAGWSIPLRYQEYFTVGEDHLSRYSAVLNAVEIKSTFYRAPRPSTIQRWMDAVPVPFRFSLKLSKSITHVLLAKSPGRAGVLLFGVLDEDLH
ncbi:MAG: DUF72 domain-containing protein [Bacteroidota bacterium]|nr:DUF72 domain-containing protein [Bacteroidota bacterium]